MIDRSQPGEITRLIQEHRHGSRDALDRLFPRVYEELRRMARWTRRSRASPG